MISPRLLKQAVETHTLNRLTSSHRRPVSTARGGQEQHSHSQEAALTPTTQPFPWLTRPPLLVVYGRQLPACHSPPSRLAQLTRQLVTRCWPSGRPGTTAGHHLRGSPCGIRRGSGFLRSLLDRLQSKALTAKSDCIGRSDYLGTAAAWLPTVHIRRRGRGIHEPLPFPSRTSLPLPTVLSVV
eukprot:COSAG01_NODE_389_length_17708_cov_111.404452_13_plen_183_part_00